MKINNETKVGILTVVVLGLVILGFNFLKGKDVFDKTTHIYAVFDKLGSLTKSNEVKINGLVIGTVSSLEPTDKNITSIRITIQLSRDVNIPVNSVAYIAAPFGGLGSASIVVERGDGTTYMNDGDTLTTRTDEGVLGGLSSEVAPTLSKLRNTMDSLNRVFGGINRLLDGETRGNLQSVISNLNSTTAALNRMLDPTTSALAKTMDNAASITGNLRKNNDSISALLSNANRFGRQLNTIDLKPTMDTLQSAVSSLKRTINQISSTDGTLGALIYDRQLYNKLNDAVLSAEILMDDLREHPKRYVNLSVFGRKDKGGALTSPVKKDTIPQ